jgi:hypothetical protein
MHQRGQTERKGNPANPLGVPRPQAADHGVRGAFDERFGLFRAIRIVARVHHDATRPAPEVPSVALVAGCGRGDAREIEMSG